VLFDLRRSLCVEEEAARTCGGAHRLRYLHFAFGIELVGVGRSLRVMLCVAFKGQPVFIDSSATANRNIIL